MNLNEIYGKRRMGRQIEGMAAILLPFDDQDRIAEESFMALVRETLDAGLTPAVNMDTGYANLITDEERTRVLHLTREAANGREFVAGAFVEGRSGDLVELYRREIGEIERFGGTPILFQTSRLHNVPAQEVVSTYACAVAGVERAYAFELGRVFAPNGEIWSEEVVTGIMEIPEIKGMKHSSLDRIVELARLDLRDRIRPEFSIFTGNDLGIDMIEFGSDYLLGLATFSPAKFAERDRLWAAGDPGYLALADALQHLGNLAFRAPVPAYKHSAAVFLHLLGKIPTDRTHPRAPTRPAWEAEILRDCAIRLDLL
ncbi:hypothetical protein OP10G_0685 [Fimbriimonas ginsengisoli Gsoil 348]|uniref:Dihydrodipicolinate synthase family protein n=2 Tax=Fimbriimonas ginsengisoli TaxID=1005039 RepID=A0A068NKI6_FIMGI|nr:hypothetical protein OP10G_0685 [Fimbriimonas ginsengisoli Gsoil 348]